MAAKNTFGVVVKIGATSTPTTTLANVFNIDPPELSRGTIDTTTHASADNTMEFMAEKLFDPGELSIDMNYIAGSADDAAIITLMAADSYFVQWTAAKGTGGPATFTAPVIGISYKENAKAVTGKQTATLKCKVIGKVVVA